MKQLMIALLALALPFALTAQDSEVEKVFARHVGTDGYTSIHINQHMFKLFATLADESDEKEFKEVTSDLTGIKLLSVDSATEANQSQTLFEEVTKALKKPNYEELMTIQDGKDIIRFMIREQGNTVSELVMAGDKFIIVLLGDIDLKKISKLSETMDIDGLEHLEKVE